MTPVKDILRSPRFMREVSLLLFFFAGLNLLIGVLLMTAANTPEVLAEAVSSFVVAAVYAGLALMLRRGSLIALWAAGILFVLDFVVVLMQPLGTGGGLNIVGRGILIYVLVRYIKRERVAA